MTVSTYNVENDVYVGLPVVLGNNGIKKKMFVKLDGEEIVNMKNSIKVIKDAINKV